MIVTSSPRRNGAVRTGLALTVSLSVLAALTGCGSQSGASAGNEKGAEAQTQPVAKGCAHAPRDNGKKGTRTVTGTHRGDVTDVPAQPKRVVALWRVGSELADLCVVPVGQIDGEFAKEEIDPATWSNYAKVPVVGSYEGVDVEKVIELEPDLILGMDHGGLSIDYDELAKVAPTVILKIKEPTDVWANYPQVADIMGRSADYDVKNKAVNAQLDEIADKHGETLSQLRVTSLNYADQLYVDTSKSLTWQRIDRAGFGYNPRYTKNPERYAEALATENLPDLADQDIIFFEANDDGTPMADLAPLLKSASFKRLPAVRAGNVFPLATGTTYTFQAAQQQIDDLRHAAENYRATDR